MRLTMRFVLCLLGVLAYLMAWQLTARADSFTPRVTNIFFNKDGLAYQDPVKFTIRCFGYDMFENDGKIDINNPPKPKEIGSYVPYEIYSFTDTCLSYGCSIYGPYLPKYTFSDYCNLEGETNGQRFNIEKYSKSPVEVLPFDMKKCNSESENYCLFCGENNLTLCNKLFFEIPAEVDYDHVISSANYNNLHSTSFREKNSLQGDNEQVLLDDTTKKPDIELIDNYPVPSTNNSLDANNTKPTTESLAKIYDSNSNSNNNINNQKITWWHSLVCWLPNLFGLKCGQ